MNKGAEEISLIGREFAESLSSCQLCPHECRVNRLEGELGKCRTGPDAMIASWNLHFGEEPSLSGGSGSGTIFLSNCNLSCKYCQNYSISQLGEGAIYSAHQFSEIFLTLQNRGADNINFVTPTHQIAAVVQALALAVSRGLEIPVVFNSSGYEKADILALLDGIIDIYLVDMRYNSNETAREFSGCENYVENNRAAVFEMYRQVGLLHTDEKGVAKSGVMIRHLVLPNDLA